MNITRLGGYIALALPLIFIVGLSIVIHQNPPWFSFTDNASATWVPLKIPLAGGSTAS